METENKKCQSQESDTLTSVFGEMEKGKISESDRLQNKSHTKVNQLHSFHVCTFVIPRSLVRKKYVTLKEIYRLEK